jgi:hypothetical protein
MGDQVAFVGLEVNGRGQHQGRHQRGDDPYREAQEEVGPADFLPVTGQARGLEHRFHPGEGQDTEGDVGDELGIASNPGSGLQLGAGKVDRLENLPHGALIQVKDSRDDQI